MWPEPSSLSIHNLPFATRKYFSRFDSYHPIFHGGRAETNQSSDFEKRLKLADMMLKEKQINLKAADITSNERIAKMQMVMNSNKKSG